MPDSHIGRGVILELSDGVTKITLSPDDAQAFSEWQRLTAEEKKNLLKIARSGLSILIMVRVVEWLSGASYLIIRAGALGAAVLAVLSVIRSVTGA